MEMVINLLLFYSKILVVLLLFVVYYYPIFVRSTSHHMPSCWVLCILFYLYRL